MISSPDKEEEANKEDDLEKYMPEDLDDIQPWLDKYVNRPFSGIGGNQADLLNPSQKIQASRDIIIKMVKERDKVLAHKNEDRTLQSKPLLTKEEDDLTTKKFLARLAKINNPESLAV